MHFPGTNGATDRQLSPDRALTYVAMILVTDSRHQNLGSMPKRLFDEKLADDIIHSIGVSVGLIAVVAMLAAAVFRLPAASTVSLTIYGAGLLAMLGCSAAYHMVLP
jgi:predicted membrane channel-forming protein YqfA (hemolysin III family)